MIGLGKKQPRLVALAAAALALGGLAVVHPPVLRAAQAAPAGTVHLPDLRTVIPDEGFGIVEGPDGPEFRYTHLVVNAGAGPLRIQPTYSTTAGTYLGTQQLTTHDTSDHWSVASTRRVADDFRYHAEHGHFHFPLATFGLYGLAADGGPGALVTLSPKVGFCISDSYVYDSSLPHAGVGHDLWGSCSDPTSLRGLAVGGADEYDYRDPGQSIPMTGVPDGTYWFRAMSDPNDDFVESDESNNETDVEVRIANGSVTPIVRRQPDTTPCGVALQGVGDGDLISGTAPLAASTTVSDPEAVTYLLDGTTIGSSTGAAPHAVDWDSTAVVDGRHWLAARARTASGTTCTSPVLAVDVDNSSGPDTTGPQVLFTDPEPGSTVGGRVAIAVSAADASGVQQVQFLLDGKPLRSPVTEPPYSLVWDSRTVATGRHSLGARATDRRGNSTTTSIGVTVAYLPPPRPISIDGSVVARGADRLTTPRLSTGFDREVVLALVSYDGPAGADQQGATVSGAGLTWQLVKRASSQSGSSEVWAARTTTRLRAARVRAVPLVTGFDGMLSVLTFRNGARTGVASAAGAPSGAPDFYVPAVQEGSMVVAAGNDWDHALARVPAGGQVLRRQWLDQAQGDTFWVQSLTRPTGARRLITIRDTAPTADQWNYVGVEVVARR